MAWFLTPRRIAAGYVAVGVVWILFSDLIVEALPLPDDVEAEIGSAKGVGFVIVTGLLLFVLMARLHRRYEDVVANAPLSIVVTDVDGTVVAWNPASEALWGWTATEALGSFVPWIDEADRPAFLRHLRAVTAGDRPVHTVRARHRRDGSVLEVRKSYAAFEDASGRRLVAILSDDVTAQVAAERALEHSLRRLEGLHQLDRAILARSTTHEIADVALRHLMSVAPVARTSMVLFDHGSRQAEVLAAIHPEGFGPAAGSRFPLENVLPQGMAEHPVARLYLHPATELASLPVVRRVVEQGMTSVAFIPLVDGASLLGAVYVSDTGPPIEKGVLDLAGEVADQLAIALRQALGREALAERESHIRTILDGSPVPMLTVDAGRQVIYANPAACRAFGTDGELLGRSLADLVPAAMEDLRPDSPSHRPSPDAPEPVVHHEDVEARRLDGSLFPVTLSVAPLVGRSRPESVVVLVDLTERVELERRLAHAERMETLGQFAGMLAHDVRSYINAIGWSAEALVRGLPEDHELRADARLIGEAVAEAREMIGSVLEFARPALAGGSTQLARHMSRIGGIISRLLGPDVTVEVAIPEDLPPVALAPASLTQVLVNLATNAREAMPDGGVFRVQARPIDAGEADEAGGAPAGPHPARVRLEVSDTGAGMDAATSARVFEPFYTTRGDREGTEGGVGLGLASVHLAVVRAGGSVRVESAPGAGTRFVMDLPVAAERA